ncbi:hypothetical protein KGF54_004854 [Candida jiufengensis]|uniref:uncharacterized protein n=1 Tax=Candida jiufengensis TaxID=497108 RepID=UPI002223FFFF|nr:uncharacterized protein KGF54_004854 [Candida jiufengensis]KAI5951779.1 hypothetical protein KGF54_004854 [Candida jiufengensis]
MANHYVIFGQKVPAHVLAIVTLGLVAGSVIIPPFLGVKDKEIKTKAADASPYNPIKSQGQQNEIDKLEGYVN